ncbi:MAG: hypothetical protein Q7R47_00505 [Candidatus Diapherotrites archaeon]|nr:hypothetical protein [Candidatus Diapherotrites archaeon]
MDSIHQKRCERLARVADKWSAERKKARTHSDKIRATKRRKHFEALASMARRAA